MTRSPRYAVHPGIARMGGGQAEVDAYLASAPNLVASMYAGARTPLRPIHDALEDLALALGTDIRLAPGTTIVPVYRRHVIAQIKPASRTRIDFGLALGDTPAEGRLLATGGYEKQDRITHRIAVSSPADIDGELKRWLLRAYQRDA